ncbi:D-serine deaminase, pyridoxal phosphate-dependent [Evansella caseinilytica]|uniref:D-serine deaminase, pyridoxal phosphate-dependent n=1 Tax=Evansella caseinilytica TaxID=1503961 RepID=A0A1H3GZB6_9BACI|nr:alanine racemase [Evansella caseinilytica]SDY07874.1 D-serine deaminase, pyridoxal phosphate-dependent [Evansella caseinilytica]
MMAIETPALMLEEKKLRLNLQRMMDVAATGVQVRPHFKTHKSLYIAKLQMNLGACGITVATASEAELLLENGFRDILIAFPLTDHEKIRRLMRRIPAARVIFTVDSEEQAALVERAAKQEKVTPEVWLKVNSGLNRCGTEPGKETLLLAKKLAAGGLLRLTGVYTHAGHSYAACSAAEIAQIAAAEADSVLLSARLIEEAGIPVPHRSVGSTPTFELAAQYKGITEVRPGNAVFFDGMQVGLGTAAWEEVALTVLATIVSRKKDRLILDAGSKALTTEKGAHGNERMKGFGKLVTKEELYITRVSEEHGVVAFNQQQPSPGVETGGTGLSLNDRVAIIPNHACPVVNLFDHYYFMKEDGGVDILPVDARGMSQ